MKISKNSKGIGWEKENDVNIDGGNIDLSSYAKKKDIPTKTSQLQNDSNFISSIPEEYVTEQELTAKGLATETFVTNKIAEAQLGGGEISELNIMSLILGNYQIKYNQTDDTLDFIFNGVIDNPGTGDIGTEEVISVSWAVGNLNSSGNEVVQDAVLRSDFVTIETGYSYSFYLGGLLSMPEQVRVYFYDSNKGFISRTDGTALGYTTGTDIPIDIPSNAGYMRFKVAMDGNTRLDTINTLFTLKKYNRK